MHERFEHGNACISLLQSLLGTKYDMGWASNSPVATQAELILCNSHWINSCVIICLISFEEGPAKQKFQADSSM